MPALRLIATASCRALGALGTVRASAAIAALFAALFAALTLCFLLPGAALALEVNSANEAELDSVRGLGPSATARILEARAKGPFRDWADLMQRVKGIKPRTAAKLSEAGLTVNQQPYSQLQHAAEPGHGHAPPTSAEAGEAMEPIRPAPAAGDKAP